jgi:glycosyltransferase involved in cell wall biosynthesis
MARALNGMGHKISIITATFGKSGQSEEDGIQVYRIPYRGLIPKELAYLYYSFSVSRKLSKITKDIDIVCCPEFYSDAFYYSFQREAPLVTRLATPLCVAQKYQKNGYLRGRPFFKWMEKKQTVNSDGIFTSTNVLADTVTKAWKLTNRQIEIIPNSVDVKTIVEMAGNPHPRVNIPRSDYMLFFGRLEERKGVHVLAQALTHVFMNNPSIRMVFVGADTVYNGMSMKDHIFSKIAYEDRQRIIFMDNLPQQELFAVVRHACLVILPSLWEGFGFVSIEAMALGKVVIATSGSGFDEIIEDHHTGFLVPPGRSRDLAEKILYCLDNPHLMNPISINAAERAKSFDVQCMAIRLSNYFSNVLNDSTGSH